MIETTSDLELIEHLDFDPEENHDCESHGPGCTVKAEWIARCRKCTSSGLFCSPCRAELVREAERYFRMMRGSGPKIICNECGHETFTCLDDALEWLEFRA